MFKSGTYIGLTYDLTWIRDSLLDHIVVNTRSWSLSVLSDCQTDWLRNVLHSLCRKPVGIGPPKAKWIINDTFHTFPPNPFSVWRFDVNLCLFELGYLKIDGWSSLSLRRWGQFLRTQSPNYPTKPKYHSVGSVSHHNSISHYLPITWWVSPIVRFHSSLSTVRCCPKMCSNLSFGVNRRFGHYVREALPNSMRVLDMQDFHALRLGF